VTALPRPGDPVITPALVAEHGLTPDEYQRLVDMLGRTPTFTELGVETQIGVRLPDVAWASPDFIARHGMPTPFPCAPEICVEVLSPSNTAPEMNEKVAAYLEAGAIEVWLVREDGAVEIVTKGGPRPSSAFGIDLVLPP